MARTIAAAVRAQPTAATRFGTDDSIGTRTQRAHPTRIGTGIRNPLSLPLLLLLLLLATSLPSLVCAATAPDGFIYCWNTLVPQPNSDNWALGVMLPFIFLLLAVVLNAAANMKRSELKLCCSKDHRPLWGRGLPVSADRDEILRSWLWISGVPLLPLLGLAITPWILLMYTPLNRCSIGHAARLWINPDTVVALAAIHLCVVPVVLIANVLVQQHYPQRRFCGRRGGDGSGRISIRLVGAVINKAVAVLVVVWCINTWAAQGPMELTLYLVMYPIYVLFLRHAARLTFRLHELEWSPNWIQYASAVLLQPAVYLRANNAFLWFLIVLLTCLNFLDSLRGNTSERATAVLALQILACSALSIDIPQLKATMASIVFPEEQEPYVDLGAWTEDLNAMRLSHHNEIQAHNAVKPGALGSKRRASVAVKYVTATPAAPAAVSKPAQNEVTAITITTAHPTSGTVSRGSIVTVTQTPGGGSTGGSGTAPRGSISPNATGSARGSISPGPSSPAAAAQRGSISPNPPTAKTRTSIIIAKDVEMGPGSPSQPSGRKQAF